MIKEVLQPDTKGLSDTDNYIHSHAEGFEFTNVTNSMEADVHEGYERHAKHFVNFFKETDKILELGCGAGNLQYWVKKYLPNITYVTLDINALTPNSPYITKETHFTVFTNKPYLLVENNLPLKFDYIISFEHFEHIDISTLKVFFENIKKHCHENTKVIATASIQTFGGPHPSNPHVSVFSKERWTEIIESMGFKMLDEVHLTEENCPPNFEHWQTIDLCFKLK
jgi:cyclopropane fatty-acyl-phospholipid synthase-like methyltransferase